MNGDEIEFIIHEKRLAMREKWNRTLPTAELFSNRWEKAEFLGFGEGTSVYDSAIVMGEVSVGKNVWVGPNTILDGTGGRLSIGDGCDVSMGVQIYTHDTVKRCISGGKCPIENGDVSIGNNCYIAPMTIISKGVKIGNHCVVAAHSFVNSSFDDFSIIAGIPARKIGEIKIVDDSIEYIYYS